jgi:hypothetical protein
MKLAAFVLAAGLSAVGVRSQQVEDCVQRVPALRDVTQCVRDCITRAYDSITECEVDDVKCQCRDQRGVLDYVTSCTIGRLCPELYFAPIGQGVEEGERWPQLPFPG